MKILVTILVLIIAGAGVYAVCNTRAHAVEHYVCVAPPGSAMQPAATGLAIDYPNATAIVSGGSNVGVYRSLTVTTDEVTWQRGAEFTFERRSGKFTVMRNNGNVVSLAAADCTPASIYDRYVSWVH